MSRPRRLILDTNLLVLFAVGRVEREWILTHKRVQSYTETDYELLLDTLRNFEQVLFTPSILTETSNLLQQTHENAAARLLSFLSALIQRSSEEHYVPSRDAAAEALFPLFGLTDTALLHGLPEGTAVLTDDGHLYNALLHKGKLAIHFDHLRALS